MPSTTTINWLFNDICYLFIAYFDWKFGAFQQTVVSVYYILKCKAKQNKSLAAVVLSVLIISKDSIKWSNC